MSDLAELTPAQVADLRDAWTAAGHAPERFDSALAGTPQEAAQDPLSGLTEADLQSSLERPALDAQQAHSLAAELRAAGVSDDQIAAALRADGFEPLAEDERTEEQVLFDRAFAPGPPSAYKIDWFGRTPADMTPDAVFAANAEWQQWAADVGFPTQIGPAVVEMAVDRGQWLKAQDEPTRALWRQEQAVQIERLAGGEDKVDAWIERAMDALVRGGDALVDALTASAVIYDAEFLSHLANQGERLAWRREGGRG